MTLRNVIFGIFLFQVVHAAPPVVRVHSVDPDFDASKLGAKNVRVEGQEWALPDKDSQRKLFTSSGLLHQTKTWDALDQDLLILRARNKSETDLQKLYPSLPKTGLSKLKKLVGGRE